MVEMLQSAAGLGWLAWNLSSLYIGARLLRLGVRSENPPARWIGTYLFFAMGLASVLYIIPMSRTEIASNPATTLDRTFIAGHFAATIIANYGLLTFTHRVFRRDSAIAGYASSGLLVCMTAGAIGHCWTTSFDGSFATAFAGVYLAVPVVGNTWAATESFLYFRMMQRRVTLGLADATMANRFALYALGAAAAAMLLGGNWLEMQVVARRDPSSVAGVKMVSLAVKAVLGLVCAGAYLLAFMPRREANRRERVGGEA
ncbi:MAG: hypothetical protein NXI30_02130 [bacterium]|nr:hypothetical protein [bacterium]